MEARVVSSLVLLCSVIASVSSSLAGSDYTTANFTVSAPSPQFARKVGDLAEQYRKELAIHWLGKELPRWSQRCPIRVEIKQHAGGETSFVFMPNRTGRSAPSQWQMNVYGPPERILDSVLPHEVTHTIFASHFGRPLPRWADEGACTTVEHSSEKQKNHNMLIQFLKTKRGIPFNHMFAMKQYPRDILPLYAQGHSLVKYLIMLKGERHFINYIGEGMQSESRSNIPASWDRVTEKYYGFKDLSDLQVSWITWVGKGSKPIPRNSDPSAVPTEGIAVSSPDNTIQPLSPPPSREAIASADVSAHDSNDNWYVNQMSRGRSVSQSVGNLSKRLREQSYTDVDGCSPETVEQSTPLDQLSGHQATQQSAERTVKDVKEYVAELTRDKPTVWR